MNNILNAWNVNNVKKKCIEVSKKWNNMAECRDVAGNYKG
jgi:hypothetical protein